MPLAWTAPVARVGGERRVLSCFFFSLPAHCGHSGREV